MYQGDHDTFALSVVLNPEEWFTVTVELHPIEATFPKLNPVAYEKLLDVGYLVTGLPPFGV